MIESLCFLSFTTAPADIRVGSRGLMIYGGTGPQLERDLRIRKTIGGNAFVWVAEE